MLLVAALLLQAAAPASAVHEAATLRVTDRYLRLRDLASPADIPAAVGGDFLLLEAPGGARTIMLTSEEQKLLLRRRLPGIAIPLRAAHDIRILFGPSLQASRAARCFELAQRVAAGTPVGRAQAAPVACDAARGAVRLAYDHALRAPVARRDLAAGSYLGPVSLPASLPRPRGSTMTLRTRVGPVTVDRAATLLQPGWSGRHVFAQLSDGRVVAAKLEDDGETP